MASMVAWWLRWRRWWPGGVDEGSDGIGGLGGTNGVDGVVTGVFDTEGTDVEVLLCPQW